MSSPSLSLPVTSIQHTFPEVIHEVREGLIPLDKFWVSCYKKSEVSVHAKVRAELDDVDRNLVQLKAIEGDVEMGRDQAGNYTVACKPLAIPPTTVLTPLQEYQDEQRSSPSRPHRITAFAVSPDSSRFATGFLDGSVLIYPTTQIISPHPRMSLTPIPINTTKTKNTSRPHLSSITSLKFFPSSRVILSAGQDFSLTILPAELPDGSSSSGMRVEPARTMRGHTRPITGTAIVAVGRNVVSSSLDSTVKLWDVSSGETISTLYGNSPVTCMSLGERMPLPPDGEESIPPAPTDSRIVSETSSKVAFCGLADGSFQLLDLGFRKSIFQSPAVESAKRASLTSITYNESHNLLATGSSSGIITLYDTRSFSAPLTSFSRLETQIEDLAFISTSANDQGGAKVGLAIATSDGLPYIAGVVPEGPAVNLELVGADCDPVRSVHVTVGSSKWGSGKDTEVWSASDDGIVRRYVL